MVTSETLQTITGARKPNCQKYTTQIKLQCNKKYRVSLFQVLYQQPFPDDSQKLVLGECASLNVCREASELLECEEGLLEGLLRPDCGDPVPSQLDSAFSRVIDNTELLDSLLHTFVLLVLLPLLHWL